MSTREPPAESRDRTFRQIRRLTIATGAAAVGATALIGGLAATASGHEVKTATVTTAVTSAATSGVTSAGVDSGSSGTVTAAPTAADAPTSSSNDPVAVSGGS